MSEFDKSHYDARNKYRESREVTISELTFKATISCPNPSITYVHLKCSQNSRRYIDPSVSAK